MWVNRQRLATDATYVCRSPVGRWATIGHRCNRTSRYVSPQGGWDLTSTSPYNRVADWFFSSFEFWANSLEASESFYPISVNECNHSRTRCCSCRYWYPSSGRRRCIIELLDASKISSFKRHPLIGRYVCRLIHEYLSVSVALHISASIPSQAHPTGGHSL